MTLVSKESGVLYLKAIATHRGSVTVNVLHKGRYEFLEWLQ